MFKCAASLGLKLSSLYQYGYNIVAILTSSFHDKTICIVKKLWLVAKMKFQNLSILQR